VIVRILVEGHCAVDWTGSDRDLTGEYVLSEDFDRLRGLASDLVQTPSSQGARRRLRDFLVKASPGASLPAPGESDSSAPDKHRARQLSTDGHGTTLPRVPSHSLMAPACVALAAYVEAISAKSFIRSEEIAMNIVGRLDEAGLITSPAGGTAAGAPPARESGDGATPPRDAPSAGGGEYDRFWWE
jgi:hypothetical protein